ncbi:MAG: hypothetical protein H6667_02050 [Ardenticatenaceae bacterium]|nr:hypothetical protein [Ardenticatenaceae bacterium]
MKLTMRRVKVVGLLAMLILGSFVLAVRLGGMGSAAAATRSVHKIIAPAGALDGRSGVTLWHDYGSFALYKVSDLALAGMMVDGLDRYAAADEMDRLVFDAYPFDTQRDQLRLPEALAVKTVSGPALHLIQFVGPIKDEWLSQVEAAGVVLVHCMWLTMVVSGWADDNGRAQLRN